MRNCRECGKIFFSEGEICVECKSKEEKTFRTIYRYIRDNAGASVDEVAKGTGVRKKNILKFIRMGGVVADNKLENKSQLNKCKNCGATIITGSYCRSCAEKLGAEFKKI